MKKLRVAQLAPPFISVPPINYGGIELVVSSITEELVRRGHDVTLLANSDSTTKADLLSVFSSGVQPESLFSPLALKLFWLHSLPSLFHVSSLLDKANEFDIIHNHFHYLPLFFSNLFSTPMLHTYHGDFASVMLSPIERMVLEKYKDSPWVAISESQKRNCTIPLNFVSVIHNGLDLTRFSFNNDPEEYLVWLGRITPKKGIQEAIRVAKHLRMPLLIAGVINKRDEEFFETEIKPFIDNKSVTYLGSVDHKTKVDVLKKAKALLYPVKWEEPFGLVMVEALVCGTPVIGFNRGSVPEVVIDGKTGFVVENEEEMIEAVGRIDSIDRSACRGHVEENFTVERMVEDYEKVYNQVVEKKNE